MQHSIALERSAATLHCGGFAQGAAVQLVGATNPPSPIENSNDRWVGVCLGSSSRLHAFADTPGHTQAVWKSLEGRGPPPTHHRTENSAERRILTQKLAPRKCGRQGGGRVGPPQLGFRGFPNSPACPSPSASRALGPEKSVMHSKQENHLLPIGRFLPHHQIGKMNELPFVYGL